MDAGEWALPHRSLAHFLAAVGIAGLLNVRSRWVARTCHFRCSLDRASDRIELLRRKSRLLPLEATDHPLWCNRGRRSLIRGVGEAREWLDQMDRDERSAEFRSLMTQSPIRLSQSNTWNLGTLCPSVIAHDGSPGLTFSAWLPVLAWEAQRLICGTDLKTSKALASSSSSADFYSWCAPEWSDYLTPLEVFALLSGGIKRWNRFRRKNKETIDPYYYILRNTSSKVTGEFCGPTSPAKSSES